MAKQKIAVLFGGVSGEHEISLISAYNVLTNIPKEKYDILCIGITKKGHWMYYPGEYENIKDGSWENNPDCCTAVLSPDSIHKGVLILGENDVYLRKVDAVFPVLHGIGGEDGTVQGLCQLAGLPCVGCDMTSSAICMDKTKTHVMLDAAGIKTAPYVAVCRLELDNLDAEVERIEQQLGYPMFVKPSSSGSSVGVTRAVNREELKNGLKIAFAHGKRALVEKEIVGKEVECAVLGNPGRLQSSVPGQITSTVGFYDYDAKYKNNTSKLTIPADITEEETRELRLTAEKAFRACGCTGMARVDFFVTKDGIVLNEINTIPGFTQISMYPKLMETSGVPYPALLDRLIQLAIEREP